MRADDKLQVADDFEYLVSFLPSGWEEKARELGALRRCRKVNDAKTLLRVLLMHVAEGSSLRETAARARKGKLINLSDVAIMDRLRQAGEWFCWMNREMMRRWVPHHPTRVFGEGVEVRVVDATRVKEPGPTGSWWCVHYCIGLPSLRCHELVVVDRSGNGETLKKYTVEPGALYVGDRAYGDGPGIAYVRRAGGEVLVRFGWSQLPLWQRDGEAFRLFERLRELQGREVGDWDVVLRHNGDQWDGRVCALRKSRQAAERARKRARRAAKKQGQQIKPETLEAAGYVFVYTSMSRERLPATRALEMYRGRWQIELVFKRLKSLMAFGHLRKKDPESARSWLHGKLLVAFLVEALITQGEAFFPWGYPIEPST